MRRLFERVLQRMGMIGVVIVLVLGWNVFVALAQTIQLRELNSLLADGTAAGSTNFGRLIMGYDGTNAQFVAVTADGGLNTLPQGSDVTLGTFSATAGTPVQIFLAGSDMPTGGATNKLEVVLNTPSDNTASIWVGETSALAVARNNGVAPAGQDVWVIPVGGTLYFDAASGTQRVSARIRTP
mgnify:CR=1 FL=1